MQIRNLFLTIFVIIGVIIVGCAHYNAQNSCLTSQKPKTASTGHRFVSPFTGEYKRLNGVLFCYDSRGILHQYREQTL